MDERKRRFLASVTKLNAQFVAWVGRQVNEFPSRLLSKGATDYVREGAKLKLTYDDVFADEAEDIQDNARVCLLSIAPLSQTKVVHLVRHGEGFHNVGISTMDSKLTDLGWEQAHRLHEILPRRPGLVVSSPLSRALETAAGAFGRSEGCGEDTLMVSQEGIENSQSAHPTVYRDCNTRYVVSELCRERSGPSSCDARQDKRILEPQFPGFDFGIVPDGPDAVWKEGEVETEASVTRRGLDFLQWLIAQPENEIVVVTHSAFLWFTLSRFGGEQLRDVKDKYQKWFENGEMRSIVLTDNGTVQKSAKEAPGCRRSHVHIEPQQALLGNNPDSTNGPI
jgi:broad specificity phosphatase PhoE